MSAQKKIRFIWSKIRNKYALAFLVFLIWLLFFDEHNLFQQYRNSRKLNQLEKQEDYYRQKIEADIRKLEELQTSEENLEKFAREQFLMKRENEDVFVIEEVD